MTAKRFQGGAAWSALAYPGVYDIDVQLPGQTGWVPVAGCVGLDAG